MKPIVLALAVGLLPTLSTAQDPTNEEKYRGKLAESFVRNVEWEHSVAEARREAEEKRMLIFGYFSRSYAP
jgi:hypothetical protein